MSEEKIVPLKPKKKIGKGRLILFIALVVLVVCVVCCFLFPEQLNLDAVGRRLKYAGGSQDSSIAYQTGEGAAFGSFADGLLIGNENGLALYRCDGTLYGELEGAYPGAVVLTGDKLAVCYATGGDTLLGMNRKGERVLDTKAAGALLDADVSNDGWAAYLSAETGYKSVATVLNSKQEEAYKWYSSTRYLSACAVSEQGTYLAVAGLGQESSSFQSTLTLLRTDRQEPIITCSLGKQLIYELKFVGKQRLCAVGENSVLFFDINGQLIKEVSLEGLYPASLGFSREGFVSLLLNENPSGNKTWLRTLSLDGEELSCTYIGSEVLSLSVCGRYIAVLTAGKVTVYNRRGGIYAETEAVGNAARVLARSDGTVLLVGSEETRLYIP